MDMISTRPNDDYQQLIQQVGVSLEAGREEIVSAVNNAMVRSYWEIGQHIVEYEQKGYEKAEYGSGLLKQLSSDLTERYGEGFGKSNIFAMRRFYLLYPKFQTVSGKLFWSHYVELLKIDDPLERSFYEKEAENAKWGVRELKRQMKSMLFHRLALRAAEHYKSTLRQQVSAVFA